MDHDLRRIEPAVLGVTALGQRYVGLAAGGGLSRTSSRSSIPRPSSRKVMMRIRYKPYLTGVTAYPSDPRTRSQLYPIIK
jgi:hypothetical protein